MNRIKILAVFFLVGWANFTVAAEGGSGAHGGDVLICKGKIPILLDYYHAKLKQVGDQSNSNSPDIDKLSEEEVIQKFDGVFAERPFSMDFTIGLQSVGPINEWIDAQLKDVKDSNETYLLPKGCELRQAAVRQGTEMYGDSSIIKMLSSGQRGLLRVHEALYFVLSRQRGESSSEKVRKLIRVVLRNEDYRALDKAITSVGGVPNFYGNTFVEEDLRDSSAKLCGYFIGFSQGPNPYSLQRIPLTPAASPYCKLETLPIVCPNGIYRECQYGVNHECQLDLAAGGRFLTLYCNGKITDLKRDEAISSSGY